jgi:hypothetical protein
MLFLPPVVLLLVSAVVFIFMSVQPLTVVTQGNIGAVVPTLRIGDAPPPSTPSLAQPAGPRQGHHGAPRAAAGLAQPPRAQSTVPPSCAGLQAPSSWRPWLLPPTRATSPLLHRCISHPQRWARTHQL